MLSLNSIVVCYSWACSFDPSKEMALTLELSTSKEGKYNGVVILCDSNKKNFLPVHTSIIKRIQVTEPEEEQKKGRI